VLYHFDYDAMKAQCHSDIHLLGCWNDVVEMELVKAIDRLTAFTSMNAKERYLQVLKEHPWMLQRVPLAHLASYLGVIPRA